MLTTIPGKAVRDNFCSSGLKSFLGRRFSTEFFLVQKTLTASKRRRRPLTIALLTQKPLYPSGLHSKSTSTSDKCPAASNMYVPAVIYHRLRTKPSPKPAHGLCLSLLDGHLIVLQGIRSPTICELGPRLRACTEYFACCSYKETIEFIFY